MIEQLKKQLEDAEQSLMEAEAKCEQLSHELSEAKKYNETYKQGLEAGKQFDALLKGMEDGGLSREIALELIKASLSSTRLF